MRLKTEVPKSRNESKSPINLTRSRNESKSRLGGTTGRNLTNDERSPFNPEPSRNDSKSLMVTNKPNYRTKSISSRKQNKTLMDTSKNTTDKSFWKDHSASKKIDNINKPPKPSKSHQKMAGFEYYAPNISGHKFYKKVDK